MKSIDQEIQETRDTMASIQLHQKTSFWSCKIMAEWKVYSINQESQIKKDGLFNADPLKAALFLEWHQNIPHLEPMEKWMNCI